MWTLQQEVDLLVEEFEEQLQEMQQVAKSVPTLQDVVANKIMAEYEKAYKKFPVFEINASYDHTIVKTTTHHCTLDGKQYSPNVYILTFLENLSGLRFHTKVEVEIYDCKEMRLFYAMLQGGIYSTGSFNYVGEVDGWHGYFLKISQPSLNGKMNRGELYEKVYHEINHFFQTDNNDLFDGSVKSFNQTNADYNKVNPTKKKTNNQNINNVRWLLYQLGNREISSVSASVYGYLKAKGATKYNYKDIYNASEIKRNYDEIVQTVAELKPIPDTEWELIKQNLQQDKIYSKSRRLSSPNTPIESYKKRILDNFDKQMNTLGTAIRRQMNTYLTNLKYKNL